MAPSAGLVGSTGGKGGYCTVGRAMVRSGVQGRNWRGDVPSCEAVVGIWDVFSPEAGCSVGIDVVGG